ncbi:hypothetical protein AAHH88_00695 [Candidatus Hodgkinia cicadicola]
MVRASDVCKNKKQKQKQNEVWLSELAAQKVKALLTKAQIASVLAKAKQFGTKAVVKNVLVSGYALIKATVSVCQPNKRQLESKLRARLKRPPLFQTHADGAHAIVNQLQPLGFRYASHLG